MKKILGRCLLFLMCLFMSMSASAGNTKYYDSGIVYEIDESNNCASVIGTSQNAYFVLETAVIKESVNGYKVTSIGEHAFRDCSSLKSVDIPSSITCIGRGAFYNCTSLETIEIPSSVTSIAMYSFDECTSLRSIYIPSSVTEIGTYAFSQCFSLQSVYLPSSTLANTAKDAFNRCNSSMLIMSDKDIYDRLRSYDLPWSEYKKRKVNDNCAMLIFYSNRYSLTLPESVDNVTDSYLKATTLVDAFKEKYEALDEEQRRPFEELVNSKHFVYTYGQYGYGSDITTYNDSLQEAYDVMLNLLAPDRVDYDLLSDVYEQAVKEKNVSDYRFPYLAHDGIITDASQFSSNAKEDKEGYFEGLIDNKESTYFSSEWSSNKSNGEYHYLQIDLRDTYENLVLKYSIRSGSLGANYYYNTGTPKTIHVYVSNTIDDDNAWTDLGLYTCTYDFAPNETGLLPLDLPQPYRYIRLAVEETMGNQKNEYSGKPFFYWSELHAYPRYSAHRLSVLSNDELKAFDDAINSAKKELDAKIPTKPTYITLKELLDKINNRVANASPVAFSKRRYLTLYTDKPVTVPEGMTAAVVVSNGNGIRNDYRYEAGSVIPAYTGVLLRSGKGNSFYMPEGETTEEAPADNLLHGTLTDAITDAEGDNKYYKLAYDAGTGMKIGFYWGAQDGAPFVNKAGKAFLAIPTTASQSLMGISMFDLDNGMTTGITETTTSANAPLRIYDLNGRRVDTKTLKGLQPGIYVVNGKKMYVK